MPSRCRRRRLSVTVWIAALLCLLLVSVALAYDPDQAAVGEQVYTERCSTCHGDVGQGLTEEFRMTWAPGDRNCWVPGCHGGNPAKPGGFTIPKYVPALVGPGTLQKFPNALALQTFIKGSMPYQEPGVLSDDQYWALTAFLLRQNGVAPGGRLDATNAASAAVPKSGQPVPVPQRTGVAPAQMPPLSARERSGMPLATETPGPAALASGPGQPTAAAALVPPAGGMISPPPAAVPPALGLLAAPDRLALGIVALLVVVIGLTGWLLTRLQRQ